MTRATSLPSDRVHSQTMDRMYRYQRHIYDLTRKYYLIGRDRLIRSLDLAEGARVLELGCGTGRNLIVAAKKNPQAQFYGVDISRQMLISAERAACRAKVGARVFTTLGDAEDFNARESFNVSGFDRVILSYMLSMVPDWRNALDQAVRQLAESGEVHIVDFGQMERWPGLLKRLMSKWLAWFHVTPRADLATEVREVALRHNLEMKANRIAGGYAWLIVLKKSGGQ